MNNSVGKTIATMTALAGLSLIIGSTAAAKPRTVCQQAALSAAKIMFPDDRNAQAGVGLFGIECTDQHWDKSQEKAIKCYAAAKRGDDLEKCPEEPLKGWLEKLAQLGDANKGK